MATTPDEERAARQALDWLIRLRDEPDDEALKASFEAWLTQSRAHAAAWAEARRTWVLVGTSLAAGERRPSARGTSKRYRLAGLAAAALAACILIALRPTLRLHLEADYVTGVAETQQVRLADGSIVELGAESALQIQEDGAARRVRLLRGEAYFAVAPDARRPFTVVAEEVQATVVGTEFNLHLDAEGAAVAVREGAVAVAYQNAASPFTSTLRAGDRVEIRRREGAVTRGRASPEQIGAWMRGRLVVKDRPIGEAVADLRRYHHGAIILTDSALGGLRITGVYDLRAPADALRAIVLPHAGVVREITPYILLVSAR